MEGVFDGHRGSGRSFDRALPQSLSLGLEVDVVEYLLTLGSEIPLLYQMKQSNGIHRSTMKTSSRPYCELCNFYWC